MKVKFKRKNDRNHILKNELIKDICKSLLKDTSLMQFVGSIINECYGYQDFQEKITDECSKDANFISVNMPLISLLYDFYKGEWDLGDLRGGLLELLIYEIMKNKHQYSSKLLIELSCYIHIDNWKSEKSVDIGAWCCEKELGDCVECKIDESQFKSNHLTLMKNIKHKSKKKVETVFVSFSSTKALQSYITSEFPDENISHLSFIGKDNLKNIMNRAISC